MAIADDPRSLLGRAAIPGGSPAGSNVRYEPDFLALQDQVRVMESEGPLAVNWRDVAVRGCDMIATRSKDLLIASYAMIGLARTEGYGGLAIGLTIVADMLDEYWGSLEPPPKRERARVQLLEWMVEQTVPLFAGKDAAASDAAGVIAAYAAIDRIDRTCADKLTKESAAVGELLRLLRDQARDAERAIAPPPPAPPVTQAAPVAQPVANPAPPPIPAPQPVASTAPPPSQVQPQAAAIAVAALTAPTSSAEAEVAVSRLQQSMQDVARGLGSIDRSDPRAYGLLRAALWSNVVRVPMQQNGKTPLPPPPADRLAQVAAMQAAGNHLGAVETIEQTLGASPFWFDGQRLVSQSLQQLGPGYDAARLVVAAGIGGLLRRLPELVELSFSNGQAFAGEETRTWIATEVNTGGSSEPVAEKPEVLGLREARRLAVGGKLREAIRSLAAGAASAMGHRERFAWRLAQSEFCLEFNQVALALPLLAALDDDVARYSLQEWEPVLAVRVSELFYTALLHADARQLTVEEARLDLLGLHRGRMCRLDLIAAAISLKV